MLLPLLMNMALTQGKIVLIEDAKYYRLVTKELGVTQTLSKIDKETVYQLTRTPDMPATRAEAVRQAAAKFEADLADGSKVLADEPVPLPVSPSVPQRPQLSIIQGGAA